MIRLNVSGKGEIKKNKEYKIAKIDFNIKQFCLQRGKKRLIRETETRDVERAQKIMFPE